MNVVVVSPHLDDAVLSAGATMHSLARQGATVRLVTVFAGDPDRHGKASYWDSMRGVDDKAAVHAARRREDTAAAAELGVQPIWLPNDDNAYVSPRDPEVIWGVLAPLLAVASVVVLPGWPLAHADHRFTTMLVLERLRPALPVLFYQEMPYGAHPVAFLKGLVSGRRTAPLVHAFGRQIEWHRSAATAADFAAKRAAVECYAGELDALGLDGRFAHWHDRILRRELFGLDGSEPRPPLVFGGSG